MIALSRMDIRERAYIATTGNLPPGCDNPAARNSSMTQQDRLKAWTLWNAQYIGCVDAVIEAVLEDLEQNDVEVCVVNR